MDADKFLKVLLASGLLNADEVRHACAGLNLDSADEDALELLCSHLVCHGWLTKWQCDKLRDGKYKGFFHEDYKLIGHLGVDGNTNTYLAEKVRSGQWVGLRVTPLSAGGGAIQYEVVDLPDD